MTTNRPSTSKPRGVCRYYNKGPRGCLAGNSCKFLHGEETLTSFDKAKSCRYYAAGFCKRGAGCWFKHVMPDARDLPVDEQPPPPTEDVCGICLEPPITFGLLSHCTHAFCIECVKQWRDQRNNQDDPDGEAHRANKRCPYCRTLSSLVIPSSHYYPEGHPGKAAALKRYKESTSRVPCKHFLNSPPDDRYCPFGSDCLYKHENTDGTPYVFNRGVDFYMPQQRARRSRIRPSNPADALDNPLRENLNLFFRDVRAVLGDYFNAMQEGTPVHDTGSEVATPAAAEHLLDVLANELSAAQLWESDEYEDSRTNSPFAPEAITPPATRNAAPQGSVQGDYSSARGSQRSTPGRFDLRTMWRRNHETASDAGSMPSLESVSDSSSDEESDAESEFPFSDDLPNHQDDATHEAREDTTLSRTADVSTRSSESAADNTSTTASGTSLASAATAHTATSTEIRLVGPPPNDMPSSESDALALGDATLTAPRTEGALTIASSIAGLAAPPSSPSPGALPEPPFMTDGRGRVVWSRAGAKRGVLDAAPTSATSPTPLPEAAADRSGSPSESSPLISHTSQR